MAFAAFVFNYYGVNIFITGLHSYGGLPTTKGRHRSGEHPGTPWG
ncbi:hypothetical protein [Streptomyces sp. NPDC051572]